MKFLVNRKLATRISIITTAITFVGMILLWFIVSSRISSMVQNNATNQMIDAVESRAAIINSYGSVFRSRKQPCDAGALVRLPQEIFLCG